MKLTMLFLTVGFFNVSAIGVSQSVSFSGKNVSLEKVFIAVSKQTGYVFFYKNSLLKEAKPVSVNAENSPLETFLKDILKGQPFEYNIENKNIIITRKSFSPQPSSGTFDYLQDTTIDVRGRVTDENGEPLAGANVKVRGSNVGVTTDNNGNFSLKGVPENSILEVSFVGHEMKSFTVRGTGFMTISLDQKLSMLDETVVIAYGTTSRRFTTGNVATVKAADIEKQPVQNPLLALQGRVPGIEITQQTGLPGGGVTARIQGINSIRSGLDPLIVVDGVPYPTQLVNGNYDLTLLQNGSPLNFINTSDIESIDILKDADATAIYGSRAANGAILITTKKGKVGKAQLNVSLQQGWGRVGHFVDVMNTQQYLQMRWEALRNSNQIASANPSAASPFVYTPDLLFWDTTRNTNWQKTLIGGTAQYSDINASLSAGTQTFQYLIGGSFKRQTTVFPGNFDDKIASCHFNINGMSPNQRLKLQLTGSYSYDQNHLPNIDLTNTALVMEPNAPVLYNADGTLNWAQNANGRSTWINPLAYTVSTDFINNSKNLFSNALLSYKIFTGLSFSSSFGYTNLQTSVYSPFRLESNKPENRATSQLYAGFSNRNMSTWIIEPQLQYTRDIFKGKVDVLLGTTIQKSSYDFLQVYGYGFSNDLLMKTLSAASSISVGLNNSGVTRFNAMFGRVGYNWKERYLINLTGRRDGSNKFGDKNKFHNFWGIGLGWIFTNENWFQLNFPKLSFGKLRTSYGTTGNDQIPDFSYLSVYDISNPTVLYQGNIGLVANRISNPYLQWEETRKFQAGIDLGFVNDRAIVAATYVRNRSSNQLIQYSLPNVTGFESLIENLPATIQNTIWEFSVSTTNIIKKNFSWTSSINLTIPRNKLVSFPGIENTTYANGGTGVKVGQPIGVIQTSRFGGVNPLTGAYFMLDKNGNPNPFVGGQDVYVSTQSDYYGGIINTLSFKGIQLNFLFQFVRKKGARDMYYYNGNKHPGSFLAVSSNQPVTVIDHWQKPGDIKKVGIYLSGSGSSINALRNSDVWYSYDASYIRLKNVSLSWQLPASILKKAHFQNAKVFIHGQNLATITKYSGLDPETMSLTALPPLKMLTIGGQIGF